MKVGQMAKMPLALLNWLETQLDSRGFDSDICARYLISILQVHSTEILASEDDSFWIKVPIGTNSKRSSKKIYCEDDIEQIKKITAVTFLLSKTEENCGIEALVDELWEKLNQCTNSETETNQPLRQDNSKIIGETANTQPLSNQELAEKYYKAFPALNSKIQTDISFNNVKVFKWPSLKSSFKIDLQEVKDNLAKNINSVNQEIHNNKLNLIRDEHHAQEIIMLNDDADDSEIEWDHITKNTMKIIETDSDSDECDNDNDGNYRVSDMAVNSSFSYLDEWFAASEPWINYDKVSFIQNLNESESDETTLLLNENYLLDNISICSGNTEDSVDYYNLDYLAIKKIWDSDKPGNTDSEAGRQSEDSNSIFMDKKENVDIKERIKEMKYNFWLGKKLWDLSKQELYCIDSGVYSSEMETDHQSAYLPNKKFLENLYTANNLQGRTNSNNCYMKSAFAPYSAITDAKKQMKNTLLLQTCDHHFGDVVHSAAAMENAKYQEFKQENTQNNYYFKPIRPTPTPPEEEAAVNYPNGTTFRVDKDAPTMNFQSNGYKQLYIDTDNERHYYQTFTWQPLLSDESHHLLNITTLNDFVVKFELKQNDKACQTSVDDWNETVVTPVTKKFSYFHAINISSTPMDETIPLAHSTPNSDELLNYDIGVMDYWLNWQGRPNISQSNSEYKGELIKQSQQDANELLAELNQQVMQQLATEAVERFVENGVLLGF